MKSFSMKLMENGWLFLYIISQLERETQTDREAERQRVERCVSYRNDSNLMSATSRGKNNNKGKEKGVGVIEWGLRG